MGASSSRSSRACLSSAARSCSLRANSLFLRASCIAYSLSACCSSAVRSVPRGTHACENTRSLRHFAMGVLVWKMPK